MRVLIPFKITIRVGFPSSVRAAVEPDTYLGHAANLYIVLGQLPGSVEERRQDGRRLEQFSWHYGSGQVCGPFWTFVSRV